MYMYIVYMLCVHNAGLSQIHRGGSRILKAGFHSVCARGFLLIERTLLECALIIYRVFSRWILAVSRLPSAGEILVKRGNFHRGFPWKSATDMYVALIVLCI